MDEKEINQEQQEKSFADILSEFDRERAEPGKAAARVKKAAAPRTGTVVGMSGDYVLVSFGAKSEGVIPADELRDAEGKLTVKPGDSFDVVPTGRNSEGFVTLSRVTGPRPRDWEQLQEAFDSRQAIAGKVTGTTKGGLTVDVGVRAFMPASRSGAREAGEVQALVGQEILCRIIKLDVDDQDVVVDRRVVMEEEAEQARQQTLAAIEEGGVVRGAVRSVTDYGAFIDLGGVDGLLHVSDISWSRNVDPRAELQPGDVLDLKVLKLSRQSGKIALGLKQMYPDPWEEAGQQLKEGDRLHGTVTRLTDFGAFVEVRPGVEGLIHVSEMSWTKRVHQPSDLLKEGEEVEAQVLKIDAAGRRLSLGLKQVLGNPWDTIEQRYPAGTVVPGVVRRLTKFGAFVEVEEGIEGLIHISQLTTERRVDHPSEVVKIGDTVQTVVLAADREKRRLSLGMKQLEATTADEYVREHKPGDRVMGRIIEVASDHARVQLGEGVEGTCPLAGEAPAPVARPAAGSLAAALTAAWKGELPRGAAASARAPEPLQAGQLRSFLIKRLDLDSKTIELSAA
jgi:small subunit ribosomal protein S1